MDVRLVYGAMGGIGDEGLRLYGALGVEAGLKGYYYWQGLMQD
jgi:hypothetical protein